MNWVNADTGFDDTYKLWYGHSGLGPAYPDKWDRSKPEFLTLRDIAKQSKGQTITHMKIQHSIPPKLDKLAPNLTHLCLDNIEQAGPSQFESLLKLGKIQVLIWMNCNFSVSKSIPEIVSSMATLTKLVIQRCFMTDLPASLINLKNLEVLELVKTNFTVDKLPEVVPFIKSLKKLHIYGGQIHSLPPSMSKLCQLDSFVLSGALTQGIEVVGTIPSLKVLELTDLRCMSGYDLIRLSGLVNLEVLNLQRNYFTSQGISEIFSQMACLKELDISATMMASLPSSIANLTALEVLTAHSNNFESSGIPDIFEKMESLRVLDLHSCHIKSLPMSIANLVTLEVFNTHSNDFESTGIPDIFDKMESLRVLDLHHCKIKNVPLSVAKLVKLEELNLGENRLADDGMEFVCESLPWLKKLDIQLTAITSLPRSVSKMEKLEVLIVARNNFSSSGLPDIFSGLISLKNLDICDAKITTLPPSIGCLNNLEKLDISQNGFTTLPVCLQKLTALTDLDLSHNKRLQSLDSEILNLPNLKQVYTSNSFLNLPNLKQVSAPKLFSMKAPPYTKSSKGLTEMRKHYGL